MLKKRNYQDKDFGDAISHEPMGLIVSPRPNKCCCSWAWSARVPGDGMYLKTRNALCLAKHDRRRPAVVPAPAD